MKWRWLIGGVAVAVVMLSVAGGAVMAQQSDGKESRMSAFAAKVANILGLEADDVENAMEQAREELADEALADKLDELVEKGTTTQAQADEYESWIESRPDGFKLRGWPGGDTLDAKLAAMVENGDITQGQADEYKTWVESKPDFLESLEKPGHHKFRDGHWKKGNHWKKGHDRDWHGSESDSDDDA